MSKLNKINVALCNDSLIYLNSCSLSLSQTLAHAFDMDSPISMSIHWPLDCIRIKTYNIIFCMALQEMSISLESGPKLSRSNIFK